MNEIKSFILFQDRVYVPDHDNLDKMLEELNINPKETENICIRGIARPRYSDSDLNWNRPFQYWDCLLMPPYPSWYNEEKDEERAKEAVKTWADMHSLKNGGHTIRHGIYCAYDNAHVKVHNNATVYAFGTSVIEAYDKANIIAGGRATVKAYGKANIRAGGFTKIEAYQNAKVYALGTSSVKAYDHSIVESNSDYLVHGFNYASINLERNASGAIVHDHASIETRRTNANRRYYIATHDEAVAYLWGTPSLQAHDHSIIHLYEIRDKGIVELCDNSQCKSHQSYFYLSKHYFTTYFHETDKIPERAKEEKIESTGRIIARDHSKAEIGSSFLVTTFNHAEAQVTDFARVTAYNDSVIIAPESSLQRATIIAYENARVEAHGSAMVVNMGHSHTEAYGQVEAQSNEHSFISRRDANVHTITHYQSSDNMIRLKYEEFPEYIQDHIYFVTKD